MKRGTENFSFFRKKWTQITGNIATDAAKIVAATQTQSLSDVQNP
jgi:hypothetical protein